MGYIDKRGLHVAKADVGIANELDQLLITRLLASERSWFDDVADGSKGEWSGIFRASSLLMSRPG